MRNPIKAISTDAERSTPVAPENRSQHGKMVALVQRLGSIKEQSDLNANLTGIFTAEEFCV